MSKPTRNAAWRGNLNVMRWLVAIAVLTAVVPLRAAGQEAEASEAAPTPMVEVFLDRTAPTAGTLSAPERVNALPLVVEYTGAGDGDGSGLKSVTLWMKRGEAGTWAATSATATTESGTLEYDGAVPDGQLFLALRAEDNAGNLSDEPQGAGDAVVWLDRTPPVITLAGPPSIALEVGETYADPGATAVDAIDGDLTDRIEVDNGVDTGVAGTYYVHYSVSDAAGNQSAPIYRTVTVAQRYALTLVQPPTGRIEANPAPGGGKYASGTTVSLRYVADGVATHGVSAWHGATVDRLSKELATVSMTSDRTVSVTLTRYTGTVIVDVTPNSAQWTLTDGDGKERQSSGDAVLSDVPTGAVSIRYADIADMTAPESEQALLTRGGQVSFRGTYTSLASCAVSVPASLSGAPGDVVECPVRVSNAPELRSYAVRVTFDSKLVEALDVTAGSLTAGWAAPVFSKTGGGFVVSATGAPVTSSGGVLATVRLKIKPNATMGATTALDVVSPIINNGALNATDVDGVLSVVAKRFVWGDVSGDGRAGDSDAALILQRRAGLISQFGLGAVEAAANVSGEEPPVIGTLDASLILERAAGSTVKFPADIDGDGQGPDNGTVPRPQEQAQRVATFASGIDAPAGAQVGLPVALDDGGGVRGCFADLSYSSGSLEFLGVERGSLTSAWVSPMVNAQNGRIRVAAAGAEIPNGESGSVLVFRFRALQALSAEDNVLSLSVLELNDGIIPVTVDRESGAPMLESVSPDRGAEQGGSVVTLKGTNLGSVTQVYFGNAAAPWILYDEAQSALITAAPAGRGTVDVRVESAGGTSGLGGAFRYFIPNVYLTLTPPESVAAGNEVDVPVWFSTESNPASITFRLRYDKTLFAASPSGAKATAGDAATKAGKRVEARIIGPGELEISVTGGKGATIAPGLVATAHLVALGDRSDALGVVYVTQIEATGGNAKSLSAAGGVAP